MMTKRKLVAYVVSLLFLSIGHLSAMDVDPTEDENRSTHTTQSKPVEQQFLTDEECLEIYEMYGQMQDRYHGGRDVAVVSLWQQQTESEVNDPLSLIRKLTITLPISYIRAIFSYCGVLQLRPFNGKIALIGCGNSPIEKHYQPVDRQCLIDPLPLESKQYIDLRESNHPIQSLCDHRHEGYDTINPELTMNPTLVAAFGFDYLDEILPTTYQKVSYEGFDPSGNPEAMKAFNFHFGNASVYEMHHNPLDVRENIEKPYANLNDMLASYEDAYREMEDDWSITSMEDPCPLYQETGCACKE